MRRGPRLGAMRLVSPDFPPDGPMPDRLSGWHAEELPQLLLDGVPHGAVELALVCHDPDAPLPHGFTHWLLYGVAPTTTVLGRGATAEVRAGPTDAGGRVWVGPTPPPGHGPHRYYFWLYALDRPVVGEPSRADFLAGYADAVIEQARLVGTYERAGGDPT